MNFKIIFEKYFSKYESNIIIILYSHWDSIIELLKIVYGSWYPHGRQIF